MRKNIRDGAVIVNTHKVYTGMDPVVETTNIEEVSRSGVSGV
jgi:hypothetical protein